MLILLAIVTVIVVLELFVMLIPAKAEEIRIRHSWERDRDWFHDDRN